jgi:hypothetical protein
MRRKLILVPLLFFFCQTACSQDTKMHSSWALFITAGYANESPEYIRDYYDEIVTFYRNEGIPIPTQLELGRTAIVNAGFLFSRVKDVRLGFSVGYSYSPAYSSYKDNTGTLEVNGSVNSFDISLKGLIEVIKIEDYPINICLQLGVCNASASISQILKFSDSPQNNYNQKWSVSAWGPFSQAALSLPIQVGEFTISLEGGYRCSSGQVTNQNIEANTGTGSTSDHWDIGQNGFVFLVSCAMNL